ncbi:MAG TPA: hypothetical protein VL945_00080 [Candidatus Saccharimonadales bacterium]|nr:hypothetical protein [Candidatus Saccharimonadales bacterium]
MGEVVRLNARSRASGEANAAEHPGAAAGRVIHLKDMPIKVPRLEELMGAKKGLLDSGPESAVNRLIRAIASEMYTPERLVATWLGISSDNLFFDSTSFRTLLENAFPRPFAKEVKRLLPELMASSNYTHGLAVEGRYRKAGQEPPIVFGKARRA